MGLDSSSKRFANFGSIISDVPLPYPKMWPDTLYLIVTNHALNLCAMEAAFVLFSVITDKNSLKFAPW